MTLTKEEEKEAIKLLKRSVLFKECTDQDLAVCKNFILIQIQLKFHY